MNEAGHLICLFNRHVDHVRRNPDGDYIPATPKQATHRLICTRWNVSSRDVNPVKRIRYEKTKPSGYALAVCAEPIRRRSLPTTDIKLVRPIDRNAIPAYYPNGTNGSKRTVLSALAAYTKTPHKLRRRIRLMRSAELNALFIRFVHLARKSRRK